MKTESEYGSVFFVCIFSRRAAVSSWVWHFVPPPLPTKIISPQRKERLYLWRRNALCASPAPASKDKSHQIKW